MPAESISFREAVLPAADGTPLFTRIAELERPARADVLLVHGMGEHSARYFHVAARLAAHGFRLCAWDLRGHGRSGGARGDIVDYGLLLDDTAHVWRHFMEGAALPAFLYGHSLGGQLAINFAVEKKPALSGAIITSPWLDLAFQPPRWKLALARVAMKLRPAFSQQTAVNPARLSRDLEFLSAMRDPALVHHRISARMFFALLGGAAEAQKCAAAFTSPLLMIHGTADTVTSATATQRFFQNAAATDKTLRLCPDALHETHNDTGRESVLTDIVQWLETHCARREHRPPDR